MSGSSDRITISEARAVAMQAYLLYAFEAGSDGTWRVMQDACDPPRKSTVACWMALINSTAGADDTRHLDSVRSKLVSFRRKPEHDVVVAESG